MTDYDERGERERRSKKVHDGKHKGGDGSHGRTPGMGPGMGQGLASSVVPTAEDIPDELPPGGRTEIAALAHPSRNFVEFHVHPDPSHEKNEARLLYTQVKALREELLHGERSTLGVARNVRILDRRVEHLIERLALLGRADGTEPAEIRALLTEIAEVRDRRTDITGAREPFDEAVDKFHVYSLLDEDDSVLEDLLEEQAPTDMLAAEVKGWLQQYREQEIDAETDEDVFEMLEELYERAGWRVAEAAATAASDLPFLIEEVLKPARELGVAVEEFDTIPASALGNVLKNRFEAAVTVAEQATEPVEDDAPVAALTEPIREVIAERTDRPTPAQTPANLNLPLLDVPARSGEGGDPPGIGDSGVTALSHVETPVGYLLTGAFRTVGDFGGAFFVTPDGKWQWTINPWAETESVETDLEGVDTYDRLWAHAYVTWAIGEQLGGPDRPPGRVWCKLCTHTPRGTCGAQSCAFADLIDGVNGALGSLGRG